MANLCGLNFCSVYMFYTKHTCIALTQPFVLSLSRKLRNYYVKFLCCNVSVGVAKEWTVAANFS